MYSEPWCLFLSKILSLETRSDTPYLDIFPMKIPCHFLPKLIKFFSCILCSIFHHWISFPGESFFKQTTCHTLRGCLLIQCDTKNCPLFMLIVERHPLNKIEHKMKKFSEESILWLVPFELIIRIECSISRAKFILKFFIEKCYCEKNAKK